MRYIILIVTGIFLSMCSDRVSVASQLTLVVGFAPGGTSSVAARAIAQAAGEAVVVENRPGAGGEIAAQWVREQRGPDTLLFMSSTSVLKVMPDMGLIPIGIVAAFDYVAVANRDAPATLAAYLEAARNNDALRNVATAGAGSIPHLIAEGLFRDAGVPMVHVPFQGSAPAVLSVIGGHVAVAVVPFPDFIPFADMLHIVARSGKGIETQGWVGIFASPGTSAAEVVRLAEVFRHASQKCGEQLEGFGFHATWRSATELRKTHEEEYARWQPAIKRLGIVQ